jgi:hypothetical protein
MGLVADDDAYVVVEALVLPVLSVWLCCWAEGDDDQKNV